jgi:hypothetical protein
MKAELIGKDGTACNEVFYQCKKSIMEIFTEIDNNKMFQFQWDIFLYPERFKFLSCVFHNQLPETFNILLKHKPVAKKKSITTWIYQSGYNVSMDSDLMDFDKQEEEDQDMENVNEDNEAWVKLNLKDQKNLILNVNLCFFH